MKFYTNVKQYGNDILYIGYDNGIRIKEKVPFNPILFMEDPDGGTESEYHSYTGKAVKQIPFDSIKEAKDFLKQYKGVENCQMYGTDKFAYEYIARNFPEKEIKYSTALIRKFFLDIEVFSGNGFPDPYLAEEKVTSITLHDSKTDQFHTWTCKQYNKDASYLNDPISHLRNQIVHHAFNNEADMLYDFLQFWEKNYPDIVTGWYSRNFDIPYLINRIRKIFGEKIANSLSPWGLIQEKKSNIKRFGIIQDDIQYEMVGIAELDLLDLYKKYSGSNEETYKLGYIGQKNLGITKIEFDGSLHELYEEDYQRYVDYNIQDVNIIVQLDKKRRFLDLIIEVSYIGKVSSYNDSLGTVKYWEVFAYNHLLKKKQVTEIKSISVSKDNQFAGAYVKDPIIGIHNWVVGVDLESLYPRLIQQVNIGPETLIDQETLPQELRELISQITVDKLVTRELDLSLLKKYNYSLSGNAQLYRRDKVSFLSEMVGGVFDNRKGTKKNMIVAQKEYELTKETKQKELSERLHTKQLALKILINACYGACGNGFFQYFSIANAEAVTLTGQVVIKSIRNRLNDYLNKVLKTEGVDRIIAMDTDSAYLALGDVVKAVFKDTNPDYQTVINFLDNFAKEKLEPILKKECADIYNYLNNIQNYMYMKREAISEKAVWTGKKRYFMSVWDSEGVRYDKPEVKMTGVQAISSSTPGLCRDALEECLGLILLKDESALQKFIVNFKKEFIGAPIEKIAFPRGISDIEKYTDPSGNAKKGASAHIRGAINYNLLLKQHDMSKTNELIINGSKIKWVYLRSPNIIQDNVVAFVDKMPKQFALNRYIDYELQFEKSFLVPIRAITDLIGWSTEEKNSLESLF